MSRPRPAALPRSTTPDRLAPAASRPVVEHAAACVALGLLAIATAGGIGGCSGVASKSSPHRVEILPGLGPDACRPERFAAAWPEASADHAAAPGDAPTPR